MDEGDNLLGFLAKKLFNSFQSISFHIVKSFLVDNEVNVKRRVPILWLVHNVTKTKTLVSSGSIFLESCLLFLQLPPSFAILSFFGEPYLILTGVSPLKINSSSWGLFGSLISNSSFLSFYSISAFSLIFPIRLALPVLDLSDFPKNLCNEKETEQQESCILSQSVSLCTHMLVSATPSRQTYFQSYLQNRIEGRGFPSSSVLNLF